MEEVLLKVSTYIASNKYIELIKSSCVSVILILIICSIMTFLKFEITTIVKVANLCPLIITTSLCYNASKIFKRDFISLLIICLIIFALSTTKSTISSYIIVCFVVFVQNFIGKLINSVNLNFVSVEMVSKLFKKYIVSIVTLFISSFTCITIINELDKINYNFMSNYYVMISIVIFISLICWYGLHGIAIMSTFFRIFWVEIAYLNFAQQTTNVGVESFYQWFVLIGGSGATIGLVFAILLFVKNKSLKNSAKQFLSTSIYNVNENVIYTTPIVKNKVLLIPFILGPVTCASISYFVFLKGIIDPPIYVTLWYLPNPIGAYLSTFDPNAIILSLLNILVLVLIYFPFIKVYESKIISE